MGKVKDYLLLHICVMVFSFTSVFAKAAANSYNAGGLMDPRLYMFVFLMLAVCVIYAFFWQKVIKGAVIIIAVIFDTWQSRMKAKLAVRDGMSASKAEEKK